MVNPRIQEQTTNMSCSITHVNGVDLQTPKPIPTPGNGFAHIPKNEKFDGVLSPAGPDEDQGERVKIGIRCEHKDPNLVNVLKGKIDTETGIELSRHAYANMEKQCPIKKDVDIAIYKTCDGKSPGERLMAMDGHLVVEICSRIRVRNKGRQTLFDVTVTDNQIDALADGMNIGTLQPNQVIDLGRDLDVDMCYMPSAPNEPAVGDNGTPHDFSDDKYDPETATFTNIARVTTHSESGKEISKRNAATCSLADTGVPDEN